MLIDTIGIILLIMAAIKGFTRGLIVAIFSFAAIIIGLAAATKLSAVLANYLHNSTSISVQWLPILSFALVMFAVVILVRWGAKIIQTSVEFALMGWINKLGGILLYAALYIIVYSIVLFFATNISLLKPDTIASSKLYPFIQPWGPKAIDTFGIIIPIFKGLFIQLENFFSSFANKIA